MGRTIEVLIKELDSKLSKEVKDNIHKMTAENPEQRTIVYIYEADMNVVPSCAIFWTRDLLEEHILSTQLTSESYINDTLGIMIANRMFDEGLKSIEAGKEAMT